MFCMQAQKGQTSSSVRDVTQSPEALGNAKKYKSNVKFIKQDIDIRRRLVRISNQCSDSRNDHFAYLFYES